MSLFGNNGKLTFTVSEDDKKALKKGLGKDFVMNDEFLACVQHFQGAGLIHTLSMNAHVVACMKDRPTGDADDDHPLGPFRKRNGSDDLEKACLSEGT